MNIRESRLLADVYIDEANNAQKSLTALVRKALGSIRSAMLDGDVRFIDLVELIPVVTDSRKIPDLYVGLELAKDDSLFVVRNDRQRVDPANVSIEALLSIVRQAHTSRAWERAI